ncbi:MAG: GldG family protein [Treponema sp.]|jgi:gliding-associated putative ABC transporter substrate-binding component GldG|nr:GldG family protein [Treponema sp.]
MTKKQVTILTFLSIAALVLGLMVSRRLWFRLDLTRNKAYTISPVSRSLYAEIPDQVRLTYYVSDKLASIHPMPGEVSDLLREYAAYSHGKIRLTVRDPARANLADQVERLGILPQQIQTVDKDQASVTTVYTGILIEYLENIDVLPVVFSLDTLEYDLTSRIRTLIRGTSRQLGIIMGDSYRQWNEDFGLLNQFFTQSGYQIRLIVPGEAIPDTLPVLLVLGGMEDFDNWALYRIDRYIQCGGKVFFALEGVYVDSKGSLEARVIEDQGLLEMVAAYGAKVKPELALDRSALTLQYQIRTPTGSQYRISRYPHWIGILGENGNSEHPVSARFSGMDLFWPSPLELNTPEAVEGVPLFTTTGEAWSMTSNFSTNPDVAYLFEQEAAETKGKKIMAAALSGIFPSWFAGAAKPVRGNSEEELPDMPAETRPSRIIVVGDTDMASGLISAALGRRNLDFLLQAVDWLANDDDIIGIRNRSAQMGRLDRIIDPPKKAAAMSFSQILNVVVFPLLVIILGIGITWRRRVRAAGLDEDKEHSDGV